MRKNILIFCYHYATQFIDICNQYADLFDRKKYHVTVVYMRGTYDEMVFKHTCADEVIFLNQSRGSIRGLKLGVFWRLYRLARDRKFTMVICHRYKPTYLFLWIEKLVRIPTLLFVMHDLETLSAKIRCMLLRKLYRKNMYFVGVSQAVRNMLDKKLASCVPNSHIITLYNAIDVVSLDAKLVTRDQARCKFNIPSDAFVFATLGRLETNKDHITLIHAFATVSVKCPSSILLIAGEGSLSESLKSLAKQLGVESRVLFPGFVQNGSSFLKAFDVFLITTANKEAFGFSLAEAMAASVPVIGVKTGGIPEVIGDAGAVVAAKNSMQLAKVMLYYYKLSQNARNALGAKCRERIQRYFSLNIFKKTFWKLF